MPADTEPTREELLRQVQAAQAEAGELINHLRDRTVALRAALENSAQRVRELEQQRDRENQGERTA